MSFKVLIPQDITNAGKDYLKKDGCELVISSASGLETLMREAADCDEVVNEPPARDNKLLAMQNVLPTPYFAAMTQEAMDRMGLHAAMGM